MKEIKKKILKKIDKEMQLIHYGSVIFGVGLFIAAIISLIATYGTLSPMGARIATGVLIMFGIVVGLINVTSKETISFLIASIVIVMLIGPFMSSIIQTFAIDQTGNTSKLLGEIFKNLIGLIVPAALIVSLKTIFVTAKDE